MGEWVLGLAVALLALALVAMWGRRRWLSAQGGLFDCALRLSPTRTLWALGIARYRGDRLEWYRVFSVAFRPRLVLDRRQTTWVSRRRPSPEESTVLFTDHEVVTLRGVDRKGTSRTWELAMGPASATGLMSWLEASAPGSEVQRQPSADEPPTD